MARAPRESEPRLAVEHLAPWIEGAGVPARSWIARLALVGAVLVAADAAVRRLVPAPSFSTSFTMPYNGLAHLGAFVDHVRRDRRAGRRIVILLGESSARTRIPAGSRNFAELYAADLRREAGWGDAAVYNFSVAGLDPASKFYIAEALADSVDALLVSVNVRTLEPGATRAVTYPELWTELRPRVDAQDARYLTNPPRTGETSALASVEPALEEWLGAAWAAWGRRIELKDLALQAAHPRRWVARRLAGGEGGAGKGTVWDGPLAAFPPALKAEFLRRYAAAWPRGPLAADAADLHFLDRLFALARRAPCRVAAFASPYSRDLNAAHAFCDERVYARDAELIGRAARARGVLFLDYNDPARAFDPRPGEDYTQAFEHYTERGLRLFTARLHRDTRRVVTGRPAP